jgi:AcrR family transcriptional regulator
MAGSLSSPNASGFESSTPGLLPVSPGAGRRERRAAETRLRLFRCALELFAERGFSNVTVEDITEAADVGKGTFFNYFESKDSVLGVMAEIQLGKVAEAVAEAAAGKHPIREVLRRVFFRLAEEPGRNPNLARTLISFFVANEPVRAIIEDRLREGRKRIAQIVAAGQRRAEIAVHLNKDEVALHLQEALLGTVVMWSLKGEPNFEAWVERSFQHFWGAIGPVDRKQQP